MSSVAVPASSPLDVFGPSSPLYSSVLVHLPDVLARIVVHYASPLFPRHSQYAGNAILGCGCHAAFNTRTAGLHAVASFRDVDERATSSDSSHTRPFSLSKALTVCGWMCRPHPERAAFLLSAHSNAPQAARTPCMFVGYINEPGNSQLQLSACFADEPLLSAPLSAVHPSTYRGWEHIAVTFQPAELEQENEQLDDEDADGSSSGSRRLYHNGVLVAQDECPPVPLNSDFFLLLGRYDTRLTGQSLHGGVCDVRLYSRPLDADEVQRLYEGEEVSGEQLELRWRLDVSQLGEERYVRDSSGHSRHAVLPGEPLEISNTGGPADGTESEATGQSNGDHGAADEPVMNQAHTPHLSLIVGCRLSPSQQLSHVRVRFHVVLCVRSIRCRTKRRRTLVAWLSDPSCLT